MRVIVSEEIESVCPGFVGVVVEAMVKNSPLSKSLWKEIQLKGREYALSRTTNSIKELAPIAATRRVYKACGKDPSRYRPAAEALMRRLIQGRDIYHVNLLVDLINLASITFGYSIGGFDADKFAGETLELGIGKEGEPYEGIGRGLLNIAGLPVYRDAIGGVGTPTSDNERTKIGEGTTHLLVLINGYDGDEANVVATAVFIQQLLRKYAESDGGEVSLFRKSDKKDASNEISAKK